MPGFRVGKPRFRGSVITTYALPAGEQDMLLDNVGLDDVGGYAGAGQYVVDRSGLWLFTARVLLGPSTTSASGRLAVGINGAAFLSSQAPSGTGQVQLHCTTILELVAGDVITARVFRHSLLASTVTGAYSGWSLVRIGPVAWT